MTPTPADAAARRSASSSTSAQAVAQGDEAPLRPLVTGARLRRANRWIHLAAVGTFLLLAFRQSAIVPATLGSTWSLLISIATGGLWLLSRFSERRAPGVADGAWLTAVFFLGTSLLSTGASMTSGVPYGALTSNMDLVMLRDAILVLYFGFLLCNLVSFHAVRVMVSTIVAAVSISAFYALTQIAVGIDLAAQIVPPLTRNGGRTLTDSLLREGMLRAPGAAGHPLELSFLLAVTFPLALALVLSARARGRRVWPWALCCVLIGFALLSSLSRSALLGTASALLIMGFFWSRRRAAVMFGALAAGGLVALGLRPQLFSTIFTVFATSGKDDSVHSRQRALTYSIDMITENPFLGCGHGCLVEPFHPVLDDQFLGRLIEGGVLGLLSFGLFLAAAAWVAGRAASKFPAEGTPSEVSAREISVGLGASMTAVIIINFVLDTTGFVQAWTLMWVLVALCWSMRRLAAKHTGDAGYGFTSHHEMEEPLPGAQSATPSGQAGK